MTKVTVIEDIINTIEGLTAEIEQAKEAKKTFGRIRRKVQLLGIIQELIEVYCPEEFTLKKQADLMQALNPKKGRRSITIEVNEGDKVMDILTKYADVKDIYKKVQEACAQQGLKIVLDTIEREEV